MYSLFSFTSSNWIRKMCSWRSSSPLHKEKCIVMFISGYLDSFVTLFMVTRELYHCLYIYVLVPTQKWAFVIFLPHEERIKNQFWTDRLADQIRMYYFFFFFSPTFSSVENGRSFLKVVGIIPLFVSCSHIRIFTYDLYWQYGT